MPFLPQPTAKQINRFWSCVQRGSDNGCWLWLGTLTWNGYGRFAFSGKTYAAHRFAYERVKGEIPAGLDLDHLCRVRGCCNPAHLEPVTRAENLRRSELTGNGKNSRKTHCDKGHDLADALVSVNKRGIAKRYCRTCRQTRERNYKAGTCPKCGRYVALLRQHLARKTDCVAKPRGATATDRRKP